MANKKKINHSFCNWFVLADIGPTNGDELSLNLLKFVLLLYFFFLISFFGTSIIEEHSPAIFLYFTPKCNRSRHRSKQENLDHGTYIVFIIPKRTLQTSCTKLQILFYLFIYKVRSFTLFTD